MLVYKPITHEITAPVLPVNYKYPANVTCRNCGETFNSIFARTTHAENKHYTQSTNGGR